MSAENVVNTSLTYHVELLRFCFLRILQEELDDTRSLWNNNFIRKSRNPECSGGLPDVLFYIPFLLREEEIAGHLLLRQMYEFRFIILRNA